MQNSAAPCPAVVQAQFEIQKRLKVDLAEGQERLIELNRFLTGVVNSGAPQVPSVWVDEAWHALLENHGAYVDYLRACAMPYVKHVPGETTIEQYESTRALMLDTGGSAKAWPPRSQGDCNGGCSGCSGDGGNEG